MQPRMGTSTPQATGLHNTLAGYSNDTGKDLFEQKQYEDALVWFQDAIYFSPPNIVPIIQGNIARTYQKLKLHDRAIDQLNLAIGEGNTYAADFYALRGYSKYKLGLLNEAIQDFDNALYYNWKNFDFAYYYRGRTFKALGKNSQAIHDFSMAISWQYSDISSAYYHRGWVYSDMETYKNYEQAIKNFAEVVKTNNKHKASAYYELGRLNSIIGHLDEAIKFFILAREAGAENERELYIKMAITYQAQGDFVNAIMCYEQALLPITNQNNNQNVEINDHRIRGALNFCKGINCVNELKLLLESEKAKLISESNNELVELKAKKEAEARGYFQDAINFRMITDSMTAFAHIMLHKLGAPDQLAILKLHAKSLALLSTSAEIQSIVLLCVFYSNQPGFVLSSIQALFKKMNPNLVPPYLRDEVVTVLTSIVMVTHPLKYSEFDNVDQHKKTIYNTIMKVEDLNLRLSALWQCLIPQTFLGSLFNIAQGFLGKRPSLYSSTNKRKIVETLEGLMTKGMKLDAHTFEVLNNDEVLQNELAACFPNFHKFLVNEQIIPAHVSNGIKYYRREDGVFVCSTTATPEGHKSQHILELEPTRDEVSKLTLGFLSVASGMPKASDPNSELKPADPNSEPKPESPRGP